MNGRKNILVTGAAGFIGANLVLRLLESEEPLRIVGLDNLNDYYDPSLKEYRLKLIEEKAAGAPRHSWRFVKGSIADKALVDGLFEEEGFDIVVNLAAQAGVRYSIENPDVYIESNIVGFYNILEACRHSLDGLGNRPVKHLVYASSSSVYGGNKKVPFSVDDRVDNPVSLYAATKKSNELMAHCYSKLYDIPTTGLRFFTVYGPAGRPDMAYFGFTNKLIKGQTIQIYNYGNCRRDFTYIDDIVEGVVRVMAKAPNGGEISPLASLGRNDNCGNLGIRGEKGEKTVPYAIYNIGGGQPENLLDFVTILQEELVRAGVLPADYDFAAHKQLVPMQPGDVPTTYADSTALERDFGFTPRIPLRDGLRKFAEWYKAYYLSEDNKGAPSGGRPLSQMGK
ncbi:MAG: NAD-dependent epimerase/dehydratase family protein [Bacteroidales bacterium]|nr:NAD-dependent epimerase/dehydratase family protein [Bacteroidales bacterium]